MQTLLDPAILFFVFGAAAGLIRSNLEIPQPIARFLSLYLLMALGLKGGFALAESGLTREVGVSLACAVLLAVLIPAVGYMILRRWPPPTARSVQSPSSRRCRCWTGAAWCTVVTWPRPWR